MKNLLRPGIHWLFAFLPVAIALDYAEAAAPLIFFSASLAIVPIARLISASTENLAS
jgi:Ca2+:H+ antiporter